MVGERRLSSAKPRGWWAYTSSSIDGATSARMPSQPNGYSRSADLSTPSGIDGRETPWKPSQPAITSQRSM